MKKHSKIKGLFTLDKLFIYDTMEVQKGLTMTNTQKEILIDKVIEQIDIDLNMKDYTAIEELLYDISEEKLKGFLSEEERTNNDNNR